MNLFNIFKKKNCEEVDGRLTGEYKDSMKYFTRYIDNLEGKILNKKMINKVIDIFRKTISTHKKLLGIKTRELEDRIIVLKKHIANSNSVINNSFLHIESLEIIDENGKQYVAKDLENIRFSIEAGGKKVKVFLKK